MRNFRLQLWHGNLRNFWLVCSGEKQFFTEVSRQHIGHTFKGQTDCLTLEDVTHNLSRIFGTDSPFYSA